MSLFKNYILTIMLLLICATIKAQKTDTSNFINSVAKEMVDSSARYYYLFQVGTNPKFDSSDLKDIEYELKDQKSIYYEMPFQDFISAINTDSTKLDWKKFSLTRAICFNKETGPKYNSSIKMLKYIPYNSKDSVIRNLEDQGIIPVLIKKGMTKQQIKVQQQLAINKYENRPIEEKQTYYFSKPIFSKDKKYVLIELDYGGGGCLCVFKFVDGKWMRLKSLRCWIS